MVDRIEHVAIATPQERVRFIAASGETWTLWDLIRPGREGGRIRRVAPPSSRAYARAFVPEDANAWRRLYQFGKGESHELTPSRVAAQLAKAEYLPREKPNTNDRMPR